MAQPIQEDTTPKERDYYFDSYSHYGIHESMLKDTVRTVSYRDAMYRNTHILRDKVVLDVGCGTGILSMFAAKAGARKVYAVECSGIANQAREIIKENHLEHIIVVLQGKLEEITLPEKVDVIISEWMGYFLIYESMLNSVLYARDKFGTPNVTLFPNKAKIFMCGITDEGFWWQKSKAWDSVHGFDFSSVGRSSLLEPLVEIVEPKQICTAHATLVDWDLNTVTVEDLSLTSTFSLKATRDDTIHALASWFDTPFSLHETVILSTSPHGTPTHWKQTVFYLVQPLHVKKGEIVECTLKVSPNSGNHRDLDVRLDIKFDGVVQSGTLVQDFRLR